MCACVEHEAAARHLRDPPPFARGQEFPVLPDRCADVEDVAQLPAVQHFRRLADLRRQAAVERDDQQPACAVARLDQAQSLRRVHHHRLLQQHIHACFHTRPGLVMVQRVRRDDKGRVQPPLVLTQQLVQVRRIRRRRRAGLGKNLAKRLVGFLRRLTDRRNLRRVLLLQDAPHMMTPCPTPNHRHADRRRLRIHFALCSKLRGRPANWGFRRRIVAIQ